MWSMSADGLIHILRNRWVILTSLTLPATMSVNVTWHAAVSSDTQHGSVAALVVFAGAGWGTIAAYVLSRAATSRDRCPQQPRSTDADDAPIVRGMVLPAAAVAVLQIVLMLVALGAASGPPDALGTFVAGTWLVLSLMSMLGLAAAAVTRSASQAPSAALLVSVGVIAAGMWVAVTGTAELAWAKRLLPGGGATELVIAAWDGVVVAAAVPLMVGPTLGWVITAAFIGSKYTTWGRIDHG